MGIDFEDTTERDGRLDEILGSYFEAVASGQTPDRAALMEQHPDLASQLAAFFSDQERMHEIVGPARPAVPVGRRDPASANGTSDSRGQASGRVVEIGSSQGVDPGITLPFLGTLARGRFARTQVLSWTAGAGEDPESPGAGCVLGEYLLLERIGTGGMGTVYRARRPPPRPGRRPESDPGRQIRHAARRAPLPQEAD